MKEGDYIICKKDYYVEDSPFKMFRKKTFKKGNRYKIDSIKQSYNYVGTYGTSCAGVSGGSGSSGVYGVSGNSVTVPYSVVSTTTTSLASTTTSITSITSITSTTTTTALTTTTTTAIYTPVLYYVINDECISGDMLKEYFYSKIEERDIKLKRLNEKEKIF